MPRTAAAEPALVGVDFTSRPTRRKPIVAAFGRWLDATAGHQPDPGAAPALVLERLEEFTGSAAFARWLAAPGRWIGGFDLPFGLPRELVETLGWPLQWEPLLRHVAALPRAELRTRLAAFCAARPAGSKFAHRACDGPAGSSPSMKWVNPPVVYMLHTGVPLLLDAGVRLPGLHAGAGDQRIALEAYPGLLARELIGRRSYKSDAKVDEAAAQARHAARGELIDALVAGRSRLGIRLLLSAAQRRALQGESSADRLDAVLALLQAAWASRQPGFGLPPWLDPLEGWIASAPWDDA